MAHDAGKGAKPRPYSVSQEEYQNNLATILNNSRPVSTEDEDDDECLICGGPLYTQIHWSYTYCDDCGHRIKKQPMEP